MLSVLPLPSESSPDTCFNLSPCNMAAATRRRLPETFSCCPKIKQTEMQVLLPWQQPHIYVKQLQDVSH